MKIEAKSRLTAAQDPKYATAAQGTRDANSDIKGKWVDADTFDSKEDLATHLDVTIGASQKYIDAYYAEGCAHFKLPVKAALTKKQEQLDVNNDGKISGDDLKKIRDGKTPAKTEAGVKAPKVLAAFNPQALALDGVDDKLIALLKHLNSKVPIKYAQHDGGVIEAYIYPSSDSELSDTTKVFSFVEISEIAKTAKSISDLPEKYIVEIAINSDSPHTPFLDFMIIGEFE